MKDYSSHILNVKSLNKIMYYILDTNKIKKINNMIYIKKMEHIYLRLKYKPLV